MSQIVQARCPHCKNVLRIPAQWLNQPMRCKHCKQLFQSKGKAPASSPPPKLLAVEPSSPPPARPAPSPVGVKPGGQPQEPAQPAVAAPVAQPVAAGNTFEFTQSAEPGVRNPYRGQKGSRGLIIVALLGLAVLGSAAGAMILYGPQQLLELAGLSTPPDDPEPLNPFAQNANNQNGKTGSNRPRPWQTGNPGGQPKPTPNEGDQTASPPDNKPDPPSSEPVEPSPAPPVNSGDPIPKKSGSPKGRPPVVTQDLFPRRALAIGVNDYLIANALNYGDKRDKTYPGGNAREVLHAFGNFFLKFPNTQLFEVSDNAKNSEMPLKPVIENAITQFLSTSRPQDRVVIFFSGHLAQDEEEKVYLVPLEGDLEDPKTLIPLSWVFNQLKKSPTRQKVLILDVCRYNPSRGFERRGGEEMAESAEKELQAPPSGVQVWVACSAEQQSYELDRGSLFQEALCASMYDMKDAIAQPDDLLPLEKLVEKVNRYMAERLPADYKQTSKLYGKAPASGIAFNPDEPPAAKFTIFAPVPKGGYAGKADVANIWKEIKAIPPVRAGMKGTRDELPLEVLPPFLAKVLAEYQADGYTDEMEFLTREKDFPLRAAVVRAKVEMQKVASDFNMKEHFNGSTTAQVKTRVLDEQKDPGKAIFFLKEALEELEEAEKFLPEEPSKRWQAHYHFTLAKLKARTIYVIEYNYILGQIRSEDLPELPKGASGFQVAAIDNPTSKLGEVREWSKQLKKDWRNIINNYPETPWALMARREKDAALGLEWRPIQN